MKHGVMCISFVTMVMILAACGGGKQSAVEGKLVDWNGKPVGGVKITAAQVQPIKGYEQFEAVTSSDGSFRIRGLFPSSQYVLKPWSDKWTCDIAANLDSAPQGETAVLPSPMAISQVYTKSEPRLIADIATGDIAQTYVEGKLVDWHQKPVAGVKIIASQIWSGSEQREFETVTAEDGSFRLSGLLAGSVARLAPWSDKWVCETSVQVNTPRFHGLTDTLPSPMAISQVYTKSEPRLIADIATGEPARTVVEGKLLDGKGRPVPGVKMTAHLPDTDDEARDTTTGEAGEFGFSNMLAAKGYTILPRSHQWKTSTYALIKTASHHGEKVVLHPLKMRYTVSSEGVIADSQTDLEWVVGPDQNTNYAQAEQWVAGCTVAGGGWRMPTRQELATLYQKGVGERNMDPGFRTTGWYVWGEPRDSSSAWGFHFNRGGEDWRNRRSYFFRVFAVRSRSRR